MPQSPIKPGVNLKSPAFLASCAAVTLPFIVFVVHSLLFRDWIVDDAGISFAYARNLAEGLGLVSQPGAAPVEGYSNFTWVILLTPFFLLKLFDPTITPKILSLALVLLSFVFLHLTFRAISPRYNLVTAGVLLLLAINTSFVVWTTSGLENPLLVLLMTLFLYSIIKYNGDKANQRHLIVLGVLAALIAMTRPDGIAYFFVLPAFWLLSLAFWRQPVKKVLTATLIYSTAFACLFGVFLIFRRLYFGDLFPNTYYAKGGTSFADQNSTPLIKLLLKKPWDLFNAISPAIGVLLVAVLLVITLYLVGKRLLRENHLALFLLLLCSLAVFIVLPADWMGEYRFATAFFVFLYSYAFIIGEAFLAAVCLTRPETAVRSRKSALAILAVCIASIFTGWSILAFVQRSRQFTAHPTISFNDVAGKYTFMFNKYAERLDIRNGSIILPDLGGMLYYSDLRVYDLAGLCDKTIARTVNHDQQAFYDYIFDTLRPSIIFTHSEFTDLARFDLDDRFRQDYVPVIEYRDSRIDPGFSADLFSGVFIRKELARDKQEIISEFRDEVDRALK